MVHNSPQLVSKSFATLSATIEMKSSTTTEYHPQASDQGTRFNKKLVACLRQNISERHTIWNTCAQLLSYGYSSQMGRTTGTTPYRLVLSWAP